MREHRVQLDNATSAVKMINGNSKISVKCRYTGCSNWMIVFAENNKNFHLQK